MPLLSVYFSLGSNLGDRKANILEAVRRMDDSFGTGAKALSTLVETSPVGFSGGMFLNAVVMYRLAIPVSGVEKAALSILDKVEAIERSMGRTGKGERDAQGKRVYHSRTIDIDILFIGAETIDCPRLTVPHKGISDRPFVLVPLREVARPALKKAFPGFFVNSTI